MAAITKIHMKRVYEEPEPDDGVRVLVDRIWPRGVKKADAALDEWCKEVAPSTELRKWFGHDPDKRDEFRRRYRTELKEPERQEALQRIRDLAGGKELTLLTATKELDLSQAPVIAEALK